MRDADFYQALFACFNQDRNCKQCPLFAQGHRTNDLCIFMLSNEIRYRKNNALEKEEEGN